MNGMMIIDQMISLWVVEIPLTSPYIYAPWAPAQKKQKHKKTKVNNSKLKT
jgi:hypothetical protein